jgi:two-component system OmpR family response regulator
VPAPTAAAPAAFAPAPVAEPAPVAAAPVEPAPVYQPSTRTGAHAAPGVPDALPDAPPEAPRETAMDGGEGWIGHNGLRLNREMRLVSLDGKGLDLTRTEFDLLLAVVESKRRVRTKADLALLLRGESYVTAYYVTEADKRAVEVHMGNLRKKLGDSLTSPRWLETVRGVGYRLAAPDE